MKNFRIYKILFIIIIAVSTLQFTSCIEEIEENACNKSDADDKVVNIMALVTIDNIITHIPVDSVNINVEITYLPCGGIESETSPTYYYAAMTDTFGIYESPISNIVMNNTEDRIKVSVVAPNLDYYQQNYHTKYFGYYNLGGAGLEEIELEVFQKQQ